MKKTQQVGHIKLQKCQVEVVVKHKKPERRTGAFWRALVKSWTSSCLIVNVALQLLETLQSQGSWVRNIPLNFSLCVKMESFLWVYLFFPLVCLCAFSFTPTAIGGGFQWQNKNHSSWWFSTESPSLVGRSYPSPPAPILPLSLQFVEMIIWLRSSSV